MTLRLSLELKVMSHSTSLLASKSTHTMRMLTIGSVSSSRLRPLRTPSRKERLSSSGPPTSSLTTSRLTLFPLVAPPRSVTLTSLKLRPTRVPAHSTLTQLLSLARPISSRTMKIRPRRRILSILFRISNGTISTILMMAFRFNPALLSLSTTANLTTPTPSLALTTLLLDLVFMLTKMTLSPFPCPSSPSRLSSLCLKAISPFCTKRMSKRISNRLSSTSMTSSASKLTITSQT